MKEQKQKKIRVDHFCKICTEYQTGRCTGLPEEDTEEFFEGCGKYSYCGYDDDGEKGKVEQLKKNECNRYELDGYDVHCGDVIEVFIFPNGDDQGAWVTVRVEHDGRDYYAVGHRELCLTGLWARWEQ